MLVLDASAAVDLLARTSRADRVAARLHDEVAAAPELLDVEVLSALARLVRAGTLAAFDADQAVASLRVMPVRRVPHVLLVSRMWQLRERVRIADGCYVACAELLGGSLLTTDSRLAKAPLPGVSVLLVR